MMSPPTALSSDDHKEASHEKVEEEEVPDKKISDDTQAKNDNDDNDDDEIIDKLAEAFQAQTKVTAETEKEKEKIVDKDEEAAAAPPQELQKVAEWIRSGQVKKILAVTGAGVSVAAGIPDFRSKGTGLYDNLAKYNLPFPEAVFHIDFYKQNPQPFIQLASELWPGANAAKYKPTLTHCFLAMLAEKELLLRVYTQNIDGLDHMANVPEDLLVECHGHFRTASCVRCRAPAESIQAIQEQIVVKQQVPTCRSCQRGYVKPDIVFFGESLPDRYHTLLKRDLQDVDCCLILGTSLKVAPVSLIPSLVHHASNRKRRDPFCKRVLFNREWVGNDCLPGFGKERGRAGGVAADHHDVFYAGDCDDSVRQLARLLGWHDELQARHEALHAGSSNQEEIVEDKGGSQEKATTASTSSCTAECASGAAPSKNDN